MCSLSRERWQWRHVSVALLLLLVRCRAGFVSDMAKGVPFVCPLPLEEGMLLNETVAGAKVLKELQGLMKQSVPTIMRGLCDEACDFSVPAGDLPPAVGASYPTLAPILKKSCRDQCLQKAEDQNAMASVGQRCVSPEQAEVMCSDIPPGHYCMRVDQVVEGTKQVCVFVQGVGNTAGAVSFKCPAGFACAGGALPPRVCAKGFSCPEGSVYQQKCEPGTFCLLPGAPVTCDASTADTDINPHFARLLDGVQCVHDWEGRIVFAEPCKAGYTCNGGLPKKCPEAHRCPAGSSEPVHCRFPDICPAGSKKPIRWPRASLELCLATIVLCLAWIFLGAMDPRKGWMLVFLVIGLWAWEIGRSMLTHSHPLQPHAIFLTLWLLMVIHSTNISPIVASLIKTTVRYPFIWEFGASIIFLVLMLCFRMIDLSAACFVFLFLPGLFVTALLQGSSKRAQKIQAGSLILLQVVCILLPWAMGTQGAVSTATVAGIVVALLLPDLLRMCWSRMSKTKEQRALVKALEEKEEDSTAKQNSWVRGWGVGAGTVHVRSGGELEMRQGVMRSATSERHSLVRHAVQGGPTESHAESAIPTSFQEMPGAIGLTLKELNLFLPDGRPILYNISLTIPACETVAVMGPSGSGKSSITNVLSGRAGYGIVTGDIIVNGDAHGVRLRDLDRVVGFVPQDDVMHRTLTVKENVSFQALLRRPYDMRYRPDGTNATEEEVDLVLKKMGLDHVGQSLIGDESRRGISGGQRKRVSIGMELIAKPALLFLDEPTSGLDSTTSHEVVRIVTEMAKEQRCTSVAVIHQPRCETLMLFDNLVLLATGGFLVYAGPTTKAMEYFEKELGVTFPPLGNPADVFMDAITLVSAKQLTSSGQFRLLQNEEGTAALESTQTFGEFLAAKWTEAAPRYGASEGSAVAQLPNLDPLRAMWSESLIVQLKRAAIQQRRTWMQALILNAAMVFGLVPILGGLPTFFDQLATSLCFGMLVQSIVAQRVFGGAERVVAWRESGVGTNMVIYFVGRDLAAMLEIYFGSAMFSVFLWVLSDVQCSFHPLLWAVFAFNYAIWGFAYIASVCFDQSTAQMLCVVSSFIFLLASGVQPPFRQLLSLGNGAAAPVMAMSPIRWAFGHLITQHLDAGSELSNPMLRFFARGQLRLIGLNLDWRDDHHMTCDQNHGFSTMDKWVGCRGKYRAYKNVCSEHDDRPENSLCCTTRSLYLIGLYYRFIAMILLVVISREKWQGGQSTKALSRFCRKLSITLLLVVTNFQVVNLLNTTFVY